jgi:PAS domain S-box-containing protein
MGPTGSLDVLLDHAQDKIVVVDEAGVITYANDAVRRILGYDPSDLVGTYAFDYVHPEDVDDARDAFQALVDADEPTKSTSTYRFRAADDSWVILESRMSNCRTEDLDGYVVSSRDVTDRVAAERDRRETTARLQELAASTNDVLWMFTADWTDVLFVNAAYEDVYGGDVDELRENPSSFLETVHPDDVPRVEDAMARLSAGESVDFEYRVNEQESYTVWVWVQAEPIFEDGDVARITGFTRDITDRRRRERQLYVMDTLLRHNIRNDLTVVLGEAERIASEHPDAAGHADVIQETADALLASAEKGRRIIERMDDDPARHPVDLAHVVDACVADVAADHPDATVTTTTPGTATARCVDGVDAAITELLENAIRHADTPNPTVDVTVTETPDAVTVTVTDHATPIPAVEANVLTGDHDMTDVYHSSGLGLWLVYWLVELSNGTITVDTHDDGNRIQLRFEPATD